MSGGRTTGIWEGGNNRDKMRVIFLVIDANQGGHARSSATIANAISDSGWEVSFVAPLDSPSKGICRSEIDFISVPSRHRNPIFDWSLWWYLHTVMRTRRPHVLHSFDEHSHVIAHFLGRRFRVPVVPTICGGRVKRMVTMDRPVVVFSEELRGILLKDQRFTERDVFVAPGRMRLENTLTKAVKGRLTTNAKYPDAVRVGMICRVSKTKITSIINAVNAFALALSDNFNGVLLIAGVVQCLECKASLEKHLLSIDIKIRSRITFSESAGRHAIDVIADSDVIIGQGRVCFEACSASKPAMIMGDNGYAGLIDPRRPDFQEVASANFSARNVRSPSLRQFSADMLSLVDVNTRMCIGRLGRNWLASQMDVNLSVPVYLQAYNFALSRSDGRSSPLRALFAYLFLHLGRQKDMFMTTIKYKKAHTSRRK